MGQNSKAGYVYLLQERTRNGAVTGLYKIGKTTRNVEKRVKEYQAGNSNDLKILHKVYCHDCGKAESAVHSQLRRCHVNHGGGTEWFRLDSGELQHAITLMNQYARTKPQYSRPEAPRSVSRPYREYIPDSYNSSYLAPLFLLIVGIFAVTTLIRASAGANFRMLAASNLICGSQRCNAANVRSGNGKFLGTIKDGTIVKVLDERPYLISGERYLKVEYEGQVGYIAESALPAGK